MTKSSENDFVVFDGVQKSYDGEVLVVKDLNLNISKSEFVTMLGPIRIWQNDLLNDACRL